MAVRRINVTLWPHTHSTTVTVVIEDVSGRRKVAGGVGRITLPVGMDDLHGDPVGAVLTTLADALGALGSSLPSERGPASLEGPQGGITGQGELDLNLT
jgi:hypothetical protein